MIRSRLVKQLVADNDTLSAREIEAGVTVFFDAIARCLSEGGRIELRGFGVFSALAREARIGTNPRTGTAVPVAAKRLPHFRPSTVMHRRLNLGGGPAPVGSGARWR